MIRVWLARLQLPLVSQASPGARVTFNHDSHPAMVLVTHLIACATGTNGSAVCAVALEAEISRLVLGIEQNAQADEEAYRQAHAEFQAFLTRQQTTTSAAPQIMGVVPQGTQQDDPAVQYTALLHQMLHDIVARPEVTDFLFKVWAEVLAFASVRYGPEHAQTRALQQAVTALVWATGARQTRRNRARVIKDVPSLLQTLRDGMDLLGLPEDKKDHHIMTLSAPMTDAFLGKKKAFDSLGPSRPDDTPSRQMSRTRSAVRSKVARASDLPGFEVIEDYSSSQGWHLWERAQAEQKDAAPHFETTDSTWSNPRRHRER